jgi:hypothetical protein
VGAHVAAEASVAVQSPTAPLAGAAEASHAFASQVAAVTVPSRHQVLPEAV